MDSRPVKNRGGRPRKNIDPVMVQKLAAMLHTNTEIASLMDCDESTIRKGFPVELAKGREIGKAKLRQMQLKAAMSGNVTMLIWLGKQYLDQREVIDDRKNAETADLMRELIAKLPG